MPAAGGLVRAGAAPLSLTIFRAWQVASPLAATDLHTWVACSLALAAADAVGALTASAVATRKAAPSAATIQDFFTGAPWNGPGSWMPEGSPAKCTKCVPPQRRCK